MKNLRILLAVALLSGATQSLGLSLSNAHTSNALLSKIIAKNYGKITALVATATLAALYFKGHWTSYNITSDGCNASGYPIRTYHFKSIACREETAVRAIQSKYADIAQQVSQEWNTNLRVYRQDWYPEDYYWPLSCITRTYKLNGLRRH